MIGLFGYNMKIKRNILLNPGPATTTDTVKLAQLVPDICPREKEFGDLLESVSKDLTDIARGDIDYASILFAGSGTAVMDATINSVVPPGRSILIINNGAYGERMVGIANAYNIDWVELKYDWDKEINPADVEKQLLTHPEIACVAMVHHETTTGRLNPIKEIGAVVKKYTKVFIVDTISSFAGISFDMKGCNIDFMMSTSNKCIQGMAGCSFVICKKEELYKTKDYPKRSFYLNLYLNYDYFVKEHQTPFTPPVQTIYALRQAIDEFLKEGTENRHKRYLTNWEILIKGMEDLGFKRLLKDNEESHILTTFLDPEDPNYNFNKMHDLLRERGFTIYPGKIGKKNTFRLANMGAIDYKDVQAFLKALEEVMNEMNLKIK